MPWDVFLRDQKALSAGWLRRRLDELRLAFDYTIFQAPPVGQFSDALLLGHLCDGVVVILTAGSTRRVAARKVKERLYSANARLLGTVLNDRKFPIPDRIYKRL
jgi:Mrp family chromosome partitioning ATPase